MALVLEAQPRGGPPRLWCSVAKGLEPQAPIWRAGSPVALGGTDGWEQCQGHICCAWSPAGGQQVGMSGAIWGPGAGGPLAPPGGCSLVLPCTLEGLILDVGRAISWWPIPGTRPRQPRCHLQPWVPATQPWVAGQGRACVRLARRVAELPAGLAEAFPRNAGQMGLPGPAAWDTGQDGGWAGAEASGTKQGLCQARP